jgi:hypothetical protein
MVKEKRTNGFFITGVAVFLLAMALEIAWFSLLGNWSSAALMLLPPLAGILAMVCFVIFKNRFIVSICFLLKGLLILGIYVLPSLITIFTVKERGEEFISATMVIVVSATVSLMLVAFAINYALSVKKKPLAEKTRKALDISYLCVNALAILGCVVYAVYYFILLSKGSIGAYNGAEKLIVADVLYLIKIFAISVAPVFLHLCMAKKVN